MSKGPIKTLLIEDNPADVRLIRRLLIKAAPSLSEPPAFELLHANSLQSGLAYLKTIRFNAILLDLMLPDSEKLETFTRVHQAAPDVPIVILSDLADESLAMQAMQQGAQDYLAKDDITSSTLTRSLRYAIERQRLRAQLEEKTRQLEASEARRRAIIERNADGIIILNKQGIVRFVNPAAESILRSDQDELLGQPFRLPMIRGDTAELTVKRNSGEDASIEMRLVETEWEGEKVYLASLRDVTDHKIAKATISQRAEELASQNIALDEFAHTMAHQVQGLLSQIIGYASYIQMHYQTDLNEDILQSLNRIMQSGHKMNNVISELLLLASMRTAEVTIMPLDMKRILSEVKKRLKFQIEANNAQIDEPDDWPVPRGHTSWIEEALLNYINNAIKYGGDPPKIKIGTTLLPNNMVKIWVQDNGIGISPEDQQRLFKPHTRLQQRKVSGEGLGLSIVRRIIERCDGEVGVESKVGEGSTFWFTLPLAEEADLLPS